MRSRLTLFANVVRICVHTNMHRRACLHHRIHRRSVLRPRESIVYTFQYGKQTPLANKYSLDVSRDRLIPTHKYTCSYHIYDTRDSIRYIYISNDRTLVETLKISGTMLSSNLLHVPTNGLIVTPDKRAFFLKQRYANFPIFFPTFSTPVNRASLIGFRLSSIDR